MNSTALSLSLHCTGILLVVVPYRYRNLVLFIVDLLVVLCY